MDRHGVPLAIRTARANASDPRQIIHLVLEFPTVGGKPGRPKERPDALYADGGSDSDATRWLLAYVKPKLWRKSNRTFRRLLASLPPAVAERYDHVEDEEAKLERQIRAATTTQDWELVGALCAQLAKKKRPETG